MKAAHVWLLMNLKALSEYLFPKPFNVVLKSTPSNAVPYRRRGTGQGQGRRSSTIEALSILSWH